MASQEGLSSMWLGSYHVISVTYVRRSLLVITAVAMKSSVFEDTMPFSPVKVDESYKGI
jgi:REP element-mobilizing transposase RayT